MAQIIKERKKVTVTERKREFIYNSCNFDDVKFSFYCDENGNILDGESEVAKEKFKWCLNHTAKIIDLGIRTREYSYTSNAVLKCNCGNEMELHNEYMGACKCPKCGQWYNLFGQELNNPDMWKEY